MEETNQNLIKKNLYAVFLLAGRICSKLMNSVLIIQPKCIQTRLIGYQIPMNFLKESINFLKYKLKFKSKPWRIKTAKDPLVGE